MNQFSYQNCQLCDEPLQGRLKKKFCNDLCRSRYHNKVNKEITGNVHKILWYNRTILQYLIEQERTVLLESELVQLGFNINYVTRFEDQGEGITHLFVYDLGFYSPGDKTIKIITS